MMLLFFMAHPVGGAIAENLARSKRWLAYLFHEYREIVVVAPWLLDLDVLPLDDSKPEERERGLRRNMVSLQRCDGIILCGGRLSYGMAREREAARLAGLDEIDLIYLGAEPPQREP